VRENKPYPEPKPGDPKSGDIVYVKAVVVGGPGVDGLYSLHQLTKASGRMLWKKVSGENYLLVKGEDCVKEPSGGLFP